MRIAISQFDGSVSEVFEQSLQISLHLLDLENQTSTDEGTHPFPGLESSLEWFASRDVQVLLTGSIDPDNAMRLGQEAGVQVFTGADDLSPADNVKRFLALVMEAMNRGHGGCCCGGHDHDEDDEHECCGGGGCHDDDHECCGGSGHDDPDHVCRCR